ncbi:MAG: spore germination protein, partial [Clostridiaceae bacterium]|nr:spore germination protein [Clostridiaceae bacterium]
MFAKAKGPIDTQEIIDRLTDCPDIDKKKVFIGGKYEAYFIYITGQIDKDIIQRDFISNIMGMELEQLSNTINIHNIPCCEIKIINSADDAIKDILSGHTLFVADVLPYGISYKNV